MQIIVVLVAMIVVIVLVRSGVPGTIIAMMIPLIFSVLSGMLTATVVSAFATPIIGVPVGAMTGLWLFSKFIAFMR